MAFFIIESVGQFIQHMLHLSGNLNF
jgi:hypothetical protein